MDRKEAILEAALVLFAERGFHGTSVALIAEKAKVGAGTIYRYFKDKEVLVNVLYQEHKREMVESLLSGLPEGLPPRVLFHELWHRMVQFSRQKPKVLMFLEFHHHSPYLNEASRELTNQACARFYEFFETCRRQQVTKEMGPEVLMSFVTGAFTGLEKAFMDGTIEATTENETAAEELCWEAIRR
jgi:AcrR family transcriptional regulator